MDAFNLGKPIAGGGSSGLVGHTVPLNGFDQGEHGTGTGVSGGHVPSASNQARGYGQGENDQSGFNHGVGGEHASGGLSSGRTPIADKFTGSHEGYSHSHSHGNTGDAVSGAYSGGGTRNALTGESDAHRTGAGVGKLGENLVPGHSHSSSGQHSSSAGGALSSATGHHSHSQDIATGASAGGYGGSINRSSEPGQHHSGSARDTALTATAGAVTASALAPGVGGSHSHSHNTGTGVGALGGSGGYSTSGEHGHGLTGSHGNHGSSGLGAGAAAAGVGAGVGASASKGHKSTSSEDEGNARGTPLSNPKDLDSGSRHGLIFDKATGKYVHRHELDERK